MFAASWTDNDILGAQMALLRKQVENVCLQVKDKAAEMVSEAYGLIVGSDKRKQEQKQQEAGWG